MKTGRKTEHTRRNVVVFLICSILYTYMKASQARSFISMALINFGEEKRRNEATKKKQNTLSVSLFRRARSENVKVVFSLYRFVRGHRTDCLVKIESENF